MDLQDDLRKLNCEVDTSESTRNAYQHDASVFAVRPEAVVFPRSIADVGELVRYADTHPGVSLTPRGGGTDMGGGAIGASLIVDMTRHLNRLLSVTRPHVMQSGRDGYATVQPGMYYRDFEPAVLAHGLEYPVFPASREICTIGGIVGNNAAGERSLQYGQAVDFVRSVRAVLADGNEYEFGPLDERQLGEKLALRGLEGDIYRGIHGMLAAHQDTIEAMRPRVSKNASGYYLWRVRQHGEFNLAKLLCGSQGTLGIITQATLGLVTPKKYRHTIVVFLDELPRVAGVVNALRHFDPESLESFDDTTLRFTLRFLPDFVRILGASNIISLGMRFLPEAWMVLTGGLPKLTLLAEFSGDDEREVRGRAQKALEQLRWKGIRARLTKSVEESHKYWTVRRQSFQVIRSHAKGKRTTPFIDDIIVPPSRMPEFLPQLYDLLRPYGLMLTVSGHAGNGNFHIIPLMDLSDEKTRAIIPELSAKVYDLVLKFDGSITAEHNDGLIRGPWVQRQFGAEGYELFRQVKHLFDPKGIFNPGKKIDVDWPWALAHIRKD